MYLFCFALNPRFTERHYASSLQTPMRVICVYSTNLANMAKIMFLLEVFIYLTMNGFWPFEF